VSEIWPKYYRVVASIQFYRGWDIYIDDEIDEPDAEIIVHKYYCEAYWRNRDWEATNLHTQHQPTVRLVRLTLKEPGIR
jgi:hypothetical protein